MTLETSVISLEMVLSLGVAGIGISSGLIGTYVRFLRKLESLENKSKGKAKRVNNNDDDDYNAKIEAILKALAEVDKNNTIFQTQVRMALKIS